MFLIKRVTDERLEDRILGSFGLEKPGAQAYAAFKDKEVLGTAVFAEEGDRLTFAGVDTGRRLDIELVDGMARAAFSAGVRAGFRQGCLGDSLPEELKVTLTKRGYVLSGAFPLKAFFAKNHCAKGGTR